MGTTFKMVVTNCNLPDARTPNVLIHVNIQIVDSPVNTANKELVASAGMKVLNALIKETVMAALVHQTEIRYPHATKNPAKSPIADFEYA